jgi:hypothetical protein
LRLIFGSPPFPSDTATPGAYTFCPTLAMATTPNRLRTPRQNQRTTPRGQSLRARTNRMRTGEGRS